MIQAAQLGVEETVALAAQKAGLQFTPEELAAASLIVQARQAAEAAAAGVASAPAEEPQSPGMPGPMQGAMTPASPEVTGQGAALPGTPYANAESYRSDNPQVSRPDSPDATRQRRSLEARDMMAARR